ncbi:MAG TPA: serine--tRNA ligase [Acidimicrobiales bacterium]|jgi:seryl-tRNA synthetase|nr:serine--tRNA ligase [Acidimicrobiales bacterium]MDP6239595.1 serine--tRNA ligase [Acidimicrobiales bacterium]MDP7124857.1 serine--tRNA ligase [Acidimicrobiales bacterium]MDP7352019.1 serine--tRNA ligase [Acidimicrobiales bacterium]MEE1564716.1 serine--tRNA ligase [Acidimicrobiales bacterium]|tara:strand:+ start:1509 stop:2798 length:1290 start_codon:yes stop_codon:yes gene_type:complete
MIDVRRLRADPDGVKAAIARRGEDVASLDRVLELDERQRRLAEERDAVRNEVKGISRSVGDLHKEGRGDEAAELQSRSRDLGDRADAIACEADGLASEIREILLQVPNTPAPDCPDGLTPEENPVIRQVGADLDSFPEHQRVPHWDIGEELGILDAATGAKLSGAMFVMYSGLGATLCRALCQYGLDRNADAYREMRPPTLVRTETMVSTGHLPKFEDDAYHLERDDLWAIPTAEVPLTSLFRDEVVDEVDLPLKFMAHTSCFRREAGSAGRDTRGLLRIHEFDKVELLAYATEEQSHEVHMDILDRAESAIADLGLTYRIVDLVAGDLGASSARTFDIEVYAPGADQWLEVSSVSWFGDYQARRANARYRPTGERGTQIVNTLNGSGLAVPRVWAGVVETYRQEDGSVRVPDVLKPYMRGVEVIEAGM